MNPPSARPMTDYPVVELHLQATGPQVRRLEPVTCGIPFPPMVLKDTSTLAMADQGGDPVVVQTRTLDRWPDGSARWVLLDWQASVAGSTCYQVRVTDTGKPAAPAWEGLR